MKHQFENNTCIHCGLKRNKVEYRMHIKSFVRTIERELKTIPVINTSSSYEYFINGESVSIFSYKCQQIINL